MTSVSIIGVGRVGGALAISLPPEKYAVENLIYRGTEPPNTIAARISPAPAISTLDALPEISSEIIFITTQDSSIAPAAKALAAKVHNSPLVFHTSGSLS